MLPNNCKASPERSSSASSPSTSNQQRQLPIQTYPHPLSDALSASLPNHTSQPPTFPNLHSSSCLVRRQISESQSYPLTSLQRSHQLCSGHILQPLDESETPSVARLEPSLPRSLTIHCRAWVRPRQRIDEYNNKNGMSVRDDSLNTVSFTVGTSYSLTFLRLF